MSAPKQMDRKLANIVSGTYKPTDFIIADAKDGDMALGTGTAGPDFDAADARGWSSNWCTRGRTEGQRGPSKEALGRTKMSPLTLKGSVDELKGPEGLVAPSLAR